MKDGYMVAAKKGRRTCTFRSIECNINFEEWEGEAFPQASL